MANFEPSCEQIESRETGSGGESDKSTNNYDERYYFQCAFCPAELRDGKDLKTHIESQHSEKLFKFPCQACGFQAKGPKFLREHVANAHTKSEPSAQQQITKDDNNHAKEHNEIRPQADGNKNREGKSARTTRYKFGNRFPTTGWNQRPEHWAEPGPGIAWTHQPGLKRKRIAQNKKKTELATNFD